ncbi:hypothetical protein [Flammeovirga pacifica]|uniref:PKD domain-containing protein n=1 Tax=Flammeovirga pacifica TaxID=915059 RepID=A0A1S1YYV4_FLAPC|nr:hypothetical protein [Flammeovirga pacifica]OHX66196.1 hypothetical protein NH26_07450 [Flammeovirga pacifica]
MKKYIHSFLSFVMVLAMASCSEQKPEVGPTPTADDVTFTVTPTSDNPNIVEFTNTTPESIAFWKFSTGASDKGEKVTAEFAVKGEYTAELTVIKSGGQATSSKVITIDQTDFTLLDREDYNFLTGGGDSLDGKNWKFDKMTRGHMGIGPPEGSTPEWWQADPMSKDGRGAYDDLVNFNLNGFKFGLTNNGDSYAKSYMNDWFTSRGGTIVKDDDDNTYAITFDDQSDWNWAISERDGKSYLSLSGDAFMSWHTGGNQEYEIITLNEDELYLRTIGDDGNAWYYGFIREGFERPVVPPVEKPYEANDIFDDFAGNNSLSFIADGTLDFTAGVDNFDQMGNTAAQIGRYVRTEAGGDDGWFQNYQAELPFRVDLSSRNIFKMKVLMLSSNDFTTATPAAETPEWLGDVAMTPTVALRLEDTKMGSNGWETRAEVSQTITTDQMGTWVELTFDFSGVSDRTDFDKIIIQIGGEGHTRPGTFYVSDFRLEQ